jgi:hypothetical protein
MSNNPTTLKPKTREQKPWTPAEKALLAIIVGVVVLAIAGTFWSKRENTLPTAVIPTPTMPAHNAFDYFDAAWVADTQHDAVDDAFHGMPPPGAPKNAPGHYPHTMAQKEGIAPIQNVVTYDYYPYTMAQKEALVRASGPTLRLLRQGLNLPYQSPPVRSFTAPLAYYAHDRAMARMLYFVGSVAEQQGHWDVAANAHLDAVQEGEVIEHGSAAIGMLVGNACQAVGRKSLWGDIAQLTGPQAEAAARRMERIDAHQVVLTDALQEEKWMGEGSLQEVFAQANWRKVLMQDAGYLNGPNWPSDPLAAAVVMDFSTLQFRYTDTAAQNALLTVMLALRAYDAEHRQYPTTLNALVPKYLTQIPADPFAQSSLLHYRLTGKSYLLYSVGSDGQDNGGAPLKPAPGTDNPNDYTSPGSTGDLIGGVNIE